jgi:hypothetical protein
MTTHNAEDVRKETVEQEMEYQRTMVKLYTQQQMDDAVEAAYDRGQASVEYGDY